MYDNAPGCNCCTQVMKFQDKRLNNVGTRQCVCASNLQSKCSDCIGLSLLALSDPCAVNPCVSPEFGEGHCVNDGNGKFHCDCPELCVCSDLGEFCKFSKFELITRALAHSSNCIITCTNNGLCSGPKDCSIGPPLRIHPMNCRYYYNCTEGFTKFQSCEADEYFDPSTGKCSSKEYVRAKCLGLPLPTTVTTPGLDSTTPVSGNATKSVVRSSI